MATLKEKVKKALWEYHELQDSDALLVAKIWEDELIAADMEYKKYYLSHFINLIQNKILSNHDSITRARRELQVDYHYLRGNKWAARHKRADDIAKDTNLLDHNK